MSGYGVSPYGTSYYGSSLLLLPTAEATIFAVSDRMVRIILASEPQHKYSTLPGDALNPRTWQVTNPVTAKVYTVMSVRQVDAFTYDILTFERFPNRYGTIKLRTTTLVSLTGIPFPTLEGTCSGIVQSATSTDERRTASLGLGVKDLANVAV